MTIQLLDLTLPTPSENLALDEALLLAAEAGKGNEVLRFWELPDYAVVLGSSCRLTEEVNEAACNADGVPVLRRSSGGGSVLLGPGCLCFSLVLAFMRSPALNDVTHSYTYILERTAEALRAAVPGAMRAGRSDLALEDRKFSGNAQRRMRTHLLHHGTILYAFDLDRIERYLYLPGRQPEYRRRRDHRGFVMNLPMDREAVIERLRDLWEAVHAATVWPAHQVAELRRQKYECDEWTRRR